MPGCEMVGTDKGCRRRLIGRDYRMLMQFGDQVVDFVDVVANTPAGRGQAIAPYAEWLGERWWVLPHPDVRARGSRRASTTTGPAS